MTKIAVLALALLAGATLAHAQENREGMYLNQNASGDMMVYGPENTEGSPVFMAAGAKPSDCATGSYFENAQHQIVACDDDAGLFTMTKPAEGTMMPSGEPWSDNAMELEYREN